MSNKKAKYKSHFQEFWLSELKYRKWLKKDKSDNTLAFCTVYLKSFSVAAPGKKTLVLHASPEFHKSRLLTSTQTTVKFVKHKPEEKENIPEDENTAGTSSSSSSSSSIKGYLMAKTVADAETSWVLDVISNNYSQNSCQNKSELFAVMFKDSKIAQSFSCGSSKCGYVVNFELALFFKSLLAALNDTSHVCCFDESYNSFIKKGQNGHACVILGQYC